MWCWNAKKAGSADTEVRVPAFPGAEGFGSRTPGGRGGRVIEVTNLNPDGPGSLRAAINAKGPRMVLFRVGGTIHLAGYITIREPFLTIAGQTAPGDGICLQGGGLLVMTHDVVIRYLRIRVGDDVEGQDPDNRDAIDIGEHDVPVYNVIIDHCSVSWAIDESITTWYPTCHDVTVQWCIVSEGLHDSLHPNGPHSMGILVGPGCRRVSLHHNLMAHNHARNPLVSPNTEIEIINNVVYNWMWGATDLGNCGYPVEQPLLANVIGNYYKSGPSTRANPPFGINIKPCWKGSKVYIRGNIGPSRPTDTQDDWRLVLNQAGEGAKVNSPALAPSGIRVQPAMQAYEDVLAKAGAVLPLRDVVDARIVEEVRTGKGRIIHTPAEVGGWPPYRSAEPPADSDHDGMPDEWEREHGFELANPDDGPRDADGDGFTNVEEYLNGTHPKVRDTGQRPPISPARMQAVHEEDRSQIAREVGAVYIPDAAQSRGLSRDEFVQKVRQSGQEVADYLGIKFVRIPAGQFTKGKVKVMLTKPFELSACEVTQGEWFAVMGTKPWRGSPYAKDAPENAASYISYQDAQEWLARVNACGNRRYRLPTEAEWEWAARGGGSPPFGVEGWQDAMSKSAQQALLEYAWCRENAYEVGEKYPHPVGKKKPNPWGLYDMAGNVSEWCQDWYDYWFWQRDSEKTDPTGSPTGEFRVLQGQSFYRAAWQILGYPTSCHRPEARFFDVGFRVARNIE